jgi:CBS domain-containing protein
MKSVSQIIDRKGSNIISTEKGTSVIEALTIMANNNIGSIAVMDQGRYIGLMTERDYARKVVLRGKSSNETVVEEIMSTDLPNVALESTVEDCMHIMSENNIRYVPVVCNGELCGIISINDLIKEIISDQKQTIDQLESYIRS